MTKNKTLMIIGALGILGIIGFFVYQRPQVNPLEPTETGIEIEGTGDATVELVPVTANTPTAPSLVRSTEFKNTLSPEGKALAIERLNAVVEDLKKDPGSQEGWIFLGVYRKSLGDYEGARDAWVYAQKLAPKDVVAYNNLADLYHYFLKDFPKSELNWKKTTELKKDYIAGYLGLVDLYKYSYKEKYKETPVVLLNGIAQNADSLDLRIALAYYYKDTGDVSHARATLEEAQAVAKRLGATQMLEAITGELSALK